VDAGLLQLEAVAALVLVELAPVAQPVEGPVLGEDGVGDLLAATLGVAQLATLGLVELIEAVVAVEFVEIDGAGGDGVFLPRAVADAVVAVLEAVGVLRIAVVAPELIDNAAEAVEAAVGMVGAGVVESYFGRGVILGDDRAGAEVLIGGVGPRY